MSEISISTDLEFHLTGGINGVSNTNPFLSLGGIIANATIKSDKLDNLWDPVSTFQQEEGATEYRWIALYNKGPETIQSPHFYFTPKDPNVDLEFSRLSLSAPPTILNTEEDRPSELEIGPEEDVPVPFTKSTESYETTQSIAPDILSKGVLYICLRRVIEAGAISENRAYVLVAESRVSISPIYPSSIGIES